MCKLPQRPVTAVANTVGKVTSKNYLGDAALLEVEVNGVTLLAKLAGDTELSVGQQAVGRDAGAALAGVRGVGLR